MGTLARAAPWGPVLGVTLMVTLGLDQASLAHVRTWHAPHVAGRTAELGIAGGDHMAPLAIA